MESDLSRVRRRVQIAAGILGFALIVLGWARGLNDFVGLVAVSVGTSLLASLIFAWVVLDRNRLYERVNDYRVLRIFDDRRSEFRDEWWSNFMGTAKQRYYVLGTTNHGYMHDAAAWEDTREKLRGAVLDRRVEVKFLWLNPQHPSAKLREDEEGRSTRGDLCESIIRFWEFRDSLCNDEAKGRFHMYEYNSIPACDITWSDNEMIVTHNLPGRANLYSPGLMLETTDSRLRRGILRLTRQEGATPLYRVYEKSFKEMESNATEITDARIAQIRAYCDSLGDTGPSESELRKRGDNGE